MKPIEFEEQTFVLAKDQPQYKPLPIHKQKNDELGTVTSCWKLTIKERFQLLFSGKIWLQILTFNKPLQPQLPQLDKPEFS